MMVAVDTAEIGRFLAARRRPAALVLLALAAALAVAPLGVVPAGPDTYAHLIWTYGAARCIAGGALPLWLPDLNAGFGSPGLRLYSPLPATLAGAVAAATGSAGAGMRVVLALSALLTLAVVARGRGAAGLAEGGVLLLSPLAVYSLLGRGAMAEFCALPLLAWLLGRAASGALAPVRDGVALALLWLVHVPSALMCGALLVLTVALAPDRARWRGLAAAGAFAAGVTAWHWLPLAREAAAIGSVSALTGAIYDAPRNLLGSPHAHALDENIWLGWCAIALAAALALARPWRAEARRGALALACVALASPLASWAWHALAPLRILQFPWRWLLPATVLALAALRAAPPRRRALAAAVLLAPLALARFPLLARDPGIGPAQEWRAAGAAVHAALGGSPFLVDVEEHRPPSWAALPRNLAAFGMARALLEPAAGEVRVERWSPLERRVAVTSERPALVSLRILDYPFWRVEVDGIPGVRDGSSGVVRVAVEAGRHTVAVSWAGDPLARVGLAVAAATVALALGSALWRRP